jgi:hypothetical protein
MKNSLSLAEKISWMLAVLATVAVALPFCFSEAFRGWNGGQYAMAFVSMLIAPSALIAAFLFRARRRGRAALLEDKKILLRWTYGPDEWRKFVGEDFVRERQAKWQLYGIVAGFCVFFGVLFFVLDPHKGGPWVLGVMLGLCALLAFVIIASTRVTRNHRLQARAEVRIGEDGLLLGNEFHQWKGWGARLEKCEIDSRHPPFLAFTYSTPAKNQRQINIVRVPIPRDHDDEAAGLAAHFQQKRAAG